MTTDNNDPDDMTEAEAAARLYARALSKRGVIDSVWHADDETVVRGTTAGVGVNLGNFSEDYDADVHTVCETGAEVDLTGDADTAAYSYVRGDDGHGPVFFNVDVRGVSDGGEGHAWPTHASAVAGARPRDDLSDDLRALAERAGIDLDA